MTAPAARQSRPVGLLATVREWLLFARAAVANPRAIGAVLPSSPGLARRMAGFVDPDATGLVVELGAGTGVVTEALLARGIPASRLVVVELSPTLIEVLRGRFPNLAVIQGDAAGLRDLIQASGVQRATGPTAVVSSLPLRSLSAAKVTAIVREIDALVRPSGRWIQFTYALAHRRLDPGFHKAHTSLVWRNVPPARVDVYTPVPT